MDSELNSIRSFWDLVKLDLLVMFADMHDGTLPLYSLNFGMLILLPKCREAEKIQQYRPICLLNVSFEIFTKVLTNWLTSVAQKVISPTQMTFLPGRNIIERVVILHETLHKLHTHKQNGVILKIDFEEANEGEVVLY
jgi:hypothetical protein